MALPDSELPANPKSPENLKDGQSLRRRGRFGLSQEPPEKKARKEDLGEEMGKLDEAHQRRFRPYGRGVGQSVQQHLGACQSRSLKTLQQLAQEVPSRKLEPKYQLAQIQQLMLSSFQNLEWQVSGTKEWQSHTEESHRQNNSKFRQMHDSVKRGVEINPYWNQEA